MDTHVSRIAANTLTSPLTAEMTGQGALKNDTTDVVDFNERAGLRHRFLSNQEARSLHMRRPLMAQRRVVPAEVATTATVEHFGGDTDLHVMSNKAIESLRRQEKSQLSDFLQSNFDALERHTLLRQALAQLDRMDIDEGERTTLRASLESMVTELEQTHGDMLRNAVVAAGQLETAVGDMHTAAQATLRGYDSMSLQELRNLFGPAAQKGLEQPLSPSSLATALLARFGNLAFMEALGRLRAKMAADLRKDGTRRGGPRLWLSLKDASSFTVVSTAFDIAGEFRRELWQRASVMPALDQAATAVTLLQAPDTPGSQADAFLSRLADRSSGNALKRALVAQLVRRAVEKLPDLLWPVERQMWRSELLDTLRNEVCTLHAQIPRAMRNDEHFEHQLRERLEARQQQMGLQDSGQEQHKNNQQEPNMRQENDGGSHGRNTGHLVGDRA